MSYKDERQMRSLWITLCGLAVAIAARADDPRLRRPIAVQPCGEHFVTANRDGSLSLVDVTRQRVIAQHEVGQRLSDLTSIPGRNGWFLATDETGHQVLVLNVGESEFSKASCQVAPFPVSVCVSSEGQWASVASLWSRRLTIFEIESGPTPSLRKPCVVDLPFAPREQLVLPGDEQVIVFDSFGGRLAVVELATGKIVLERDFPGHAVRGLVLSPDRQMLLASHQMLNPDAHVNKSDIHWGLLMSNDLRWMKLDSLLTEESEIYAGGRVHPLGLPGRGGGDPAGVAMTADGTVVVCLGGVNQVMIGTKDDLSLRPVNVGRRPTAVTLSHDGTLAIVANTFDDSLSVVDIASRRVTAMIPLTVPRERTLVERGEELFYDARFSHEGWMSCHSCHTDGHSNFTRNDNLSDGGFGAPKLVLSLLGRNGTAPFAWNASAGDLPSQIRSSIHKTMQSDDEAVPDDEIAALAAYLESLPSPPSAEQLRGSADPAASARGRALFEQHDCAKCHAPPTYTAPTLEAVGLKDEVRAERFNPPSLLGIGQRDALLHDGRARSIEDVFLKYRHPLDQEWSAQEARDLSAFLRSL